jgi:predicted GNAT superfamily acetyltransferase
MDALFSEHHLARSNDNFSPDNIQIHHCDTLTQYEHCVAIEKVLWGESLAVPTAIFVVAHHTGGQILGAYAGDKLVGFTLSLVGERKGSPFLHSHMTGVLPDYQNHGIGRRLKLFQRQDALKRGIKLVEWTFDPFELRNAHLNLVRLGAVARRFITNCYGITDSPLHLDMPTDRLVAEWWLDSDRVKHILGGDSQPLDVPAQTIAIPTDIAVTRVRELLTAIDLQGKVRGQFQKLFRGGFVATGLERREVTTDFILEPAGSIAGLRLPEYRPEEFED